ncbi:SDR family oxidoreductase [Rhodococcus sp. BP-316]|jgi:NAD(P)-dependent dehydrogenase (short-subunit alcohol dehydrogenase family)|uniref:SDR family NAD(P)-dependent oxidoreductase n=1 Tax=Rhodococcus sp. BP-316 TaxID=2739445 RepID=UPI001C9A765B|nr:SDR family NAD(P)-dependent oxidoreductase [Rhodococcus sp. BP-316]MBY6683130.1 SDR family oxidoreductase [Rhodococcus sp. BP-316]
MTTTPRTVLITGAGSGIGAAVADTFTAHGDRVHLLDISESRLESVMASLPEGSAESHVVDVTDFDAVGSVVSSIAAAGQIDVLAGCAGVFDGLAGIEQTSRALWDRVIDINLTGTFNVVKPVAQQMISQSSGSIVLIGSIAASRALPDGLAYVTSKAALEGMTRRLAVDLGRYGINANLVAPGVVETGIRATSEEILGDVVPDTNVGVGTNPELMKMIIPMQRGGLASEVAATVYFLAGDGAAYITGDVIHVDGGWIAT